MSASSTTASDPTEAGVADDRVITRDFVIVTLVGLFALVGFSSTLPLVPRYVEAELGGSKVEVGLAVGIFAISAIAARPFIGKLGDQRGRRFIIVAGTSITALTVAAHGLATTIPLMYSIRLAMGVTQGAFFVGTATLVNDLAPPHRRGQATSYFSVAIYGGMAFGPLLGDVVQDRSGYAWAFAAGGISLALASVLALLLPSHTPSQVEVKTETKRSFVAWSKTLFHAAAIGPGVVMLFGIVTFTAFNGFMPLYIDEFELGARGPVFVVYGLLVLFIRVVGSKIPDSWGTVRTTTLALLGQAAGMGIMGLWNTKVGLYVAAAVLAIGGSMLYPALLIAAINGAPPEERARATSTFSMAFELSALVGGVALGLAAGVGGNRAAFFASAAFALAGIPLLYAWAARRPGQVVPPA